MFSVWVSAPSAAVNAPLLKITMQCAEECNHPCVGEIVRAQDEPGHLLICDTMEQHKVSMIYRAHALSLIPPKTH